MYYVNCKLTKIITQDIDINTKKKKNGCFRFRDCYKNFDINTFKIYVNNIKAFTLHTF